MREARGASPAPETAGSGGELRVSPPAAEPAAALTLIRWELQPPDGGPVIRGDLRLAEHTEPRSAVVICHGFKGFKDWGFFPVLARALAQEGHAALSFDFSHSGVGADGVDFSALELFAENTHSRNVAEIQLVLGALSGGKLLREPPRRIGLLGHSRGGGEAVLAAAAAGVDALVTWAAIARVERWAPEQVAQWERGETVYIANARTGQQMPLAPTYWRDVQRNRDRLDIVRAAAEVRAPWLIVHGEADETVAVDEARALHRAAGERAELLLLPGAGHTLGATHPFAEVTPELQVALDAARRWFGTHLAPPVAGAAAAADPDAEVLL